MRSLVVAAFLVGAVTPASAESPIEQFCNNVLINYVTCSLEQQIINLGGVPPAPKSGKSCLPNYEGNVRPSYDAVINSVKGKPESTAMTKDVYALFLTSTRNLMPKSDERKIVYEARVNKARDDIALACERLKLE
ncbi:hypothetical protein [Dongia sp.]|uniref:hypothetical protein n=1 Tax=Dongia sp. TaxID=1977262 RepID=UPI0035B2C448